MKRGMSIAAGQPRDNVRASGPDRLRADLDPALSQHLLDVAQAQAEPEIQPHRMTDHVRREAVALERNRRHQTQLQKAPAELLTGDFLALA